MRLFIYGIVMVVLYALSCIAISEFVVSGDIFYGLFAIGGWMAFGATFGLMITDNEI